MQIYKICIKKKLHIYYLTSVAKYHTYKYKYSMKAHCSLLIGKIEVCCIIHHLQCSLKGPVCGYNGDLLAGMENNINYYTLISVQSAETMNHCVAVSFEWIYNTLQTELVLLNLGSVWVFQTHIDATISFRLDLWVPNLVWFLISWNVRMIHKHVRKLVLKTNYGSQKKKHFRAVKEVPDMSRQKWRVNDECKQKPFSCGAISCDM